MQSSQDSLIHEATSLFRLVESIDRFVAEHENLFAYTEASQAFFSHICQRAETTRKLVLDVIGKLAQRPEQARSRYQRELIIQKGRWKALHTYVKPATDSHTLNLPAPLIRMATEDLRRLPGMVGTAIVVSLTPELMYYHNTPQSQIPPEFVFVEVPYSQGPSFFTNLTLYHELGHYVFDTLAGAEKRSVAFTDLFEAMESAFAQKLGQRLTTPGNRTWAKGVLDAWTREIFCDLFALRHLGPAFSFALIDILSLIDLMGEETEATFDDEHPAPALRFREQLRRLEKDGWWTVVRDLPSEHVSLITRLAGKSEQDYVFEFKENAVPVFVDAFLTIVPFIHVLVADITPHCEAAAEDFGRRREDIEACLLHGVVPSKLLAKSDTSSPTPVSMINAAYCLYLTRLSDLTDKLEDHGASYVQHRKNCIEKLEAWTMRAIEDSQLLKRVRAARQNGGGRGNS